MDRYLSISRAARLVGVKRGTLQKRIQAGEIVTFEGELFIDDLLKLYPDTSLNDNTMIEHTNEIKENAVGKIYTEAPILPSAEVLSARVRKLSEELFLHQSLAKKYIAITANLKNRLEELGNEEADRLLSWLDRQIEADPELVSGTGRLLASDTLLRLMTAHIRIMPSGHDFFVEGTSSLLEAGLRAGLALDYACSNGNCGKCKAKLISGDIEKISNHDYVLSDVEKANGEFLMCCNAAVSDVVIEALEAHGVEDIPEQTITAKVRKVEFPTDDVALVHLKTPRTNRLRFLAGQYVTLRDSNGRASMDISIASCPCDDMNLHFQVPRIDDDFSRYVFDGLKSGDNVDVVGPEGGFVLNESSYNSLVFIACNTGFAPVKSLIEHAMALDIAESMHLFWITADAEDRYANNLCRSWEDALDNFHFHPVDSSLAHMARHEDESSTVIGAILETLGSDALGFDYYVAGNQAVNGSCEAALLQRGIPESQLKVDNLDHD